MPSLADLNTIFRLIRHLRPHRLSLEQYYLLCYIARRGTCTTQELTQLRGVSDAATTTTITRLVTLGYITSTPCETDRRIRNIRITAAALPLVEYAPL